jgi:glycosyltransferase involved in cell wall biosynthesis
MTTRIALVVPSLADGGGVPAVARFVKDTIIRSDQYQVQLVSLSTSFNDEVSWNLLRPRDWGRTPATSTRSWDGLPYHHVGAWVGELEFQRYRARKVLTEVLANSDLIQVVSGSPAWANAVCGLGKPVALQCATRAAVERRRRDASPTTPRERWGRTMTWFTDHLDNRALRSVDAIQVENPWMLQYAHECNVGRDVEIVYAPPGVNAEAFCPNPARSLSKDPYILCVARLDDVRKNVGLLLEAYARLPAAQLSGVRLVLAGVVGPPPSFWRRAEELGLHHRITYVARPTRDALVSLYQGATQFVLPSDEEGLGVVLLEAMACGLPVVSTRSGGPEGIVTDGEDGFLVPRDDATTLADRMATLQRDHALNHRMGQRARATIEERYAEPVAGQAFLDVWDRLLSRFGRS